MDGSKIWADASKQANRTEAPHAADHGPIFLGLLTEKPHGVDVHEVAHHGCEFFGISLRIAGLDDDRLALDPSKLANAGAKGVEPRR